MITRKSPDQIALMRKAGKVVAEMHEECIRATKPGATTLDVDAVARAVIERRGARSNFLNYHGFPAVVCTSPEQRDRARHPERRRGARGRRHPVDRLRGDHRGLARRRGRDGPRRRDRRRVAATDRRHPRLARCRDRSSRRGQAPRRCRRRRRRQGGGGRVHGGAGVRRARHRDRDARGAADPELRPGGARPEAQGGPRRGHRADGQRRRARDPGARGRVDRHHPRRPPLGPLRAHDRGHRARPRGAHPPRGRRAAGPKGPRGHE